MSAVGTTGLFRPPLPSAARLAETGATLRRIRTSQAPIPGSQGPGPTDLWTWREASGAVKEQELTFFGRTVVRRGAALLTGLCHEGSAGAFIGKTGLLDFDREADTETLEAARVLLETVRPEARDDAVEALLGAVRAALTPGPS